MKYQFLAPCSTKYLDTCGNETYWTFGIGEIIEIVPERGTGMSLWKLLEEYVSLKEKIKLTDGSCILEFYEEPRVSFFYDRNPN